MKKADFVLTNKHEVLQ